MKLIDNWQQAFKFKSVQIGAISAFFYALILFSDQFLNVWNVIPQDIKNMIPNEWQSIVGCIVGVAMVLARLKKQPELHQNNILGFAALPQNAITFDMAFERLIGHEGVYSNDRNDPGNWTGGKVGLGKLLGTKFGLAANTYPNLDIKNLTLTQAKEIYKKDWWDKLGADGIHSAIVFQLWDFAINAGIERAVMELQQAIGFTGKQVDGKLGPATKAKVNEFDLNDVLLTLTAERLKFYTSLSTWPRYGKGWTNRVAENLIYAAKDN
ncbi:glycoside hydrolase family 108 protein [Acinetobacter soli]|uniref:glycoside hydrolase family 108 protein n=1 Tax=Acinetobacter soli TaxID=487316 RepID=UPI002091D696|nr:glycosyl hydrolase 108 family protein [Acinetobacter soli]